MEKTKIAVIGGGNMGGAITTALSKKEEYEELVKKIDSILSPNENDVYKLLIRGFNYHDIAKILGKEPKQIDNTIQRIRQKIKDLINE